MISLIVEEAASHDSFGTIQRRVIKFLEKGITYWMVDYEEQLIVVHRPNQAFELFDIDEKINGEDVSSNRQFRVVDFFKLPGEPQSTPQCYSEGVS